MRALAPAQHQQCSRLAVLSVVVCICVTSVIYLLYSLSRGVLLNYIQGTKASMVEPNGNQGALYVSITKRQDLVIVHRSLSGVNGNKQCK